jgi:hypothetical protein
MPQPATCKIDGSSFTIPLIDPWESFLLAPELAPVVAELAPLIAWGARQLGEVAAAKGAAIGDLDTADVLPLIEGLAPHVARICATLPREKLDRIARTLLMDVQMDGKPLFKDGAMPLNVFLKGRPFVLWQLLIRSVVTNFADFSSAVRASVAAAPTASTSAT